MRTTGPGRQLLCIVEINEQKLQATIDSGVMVNGISPEAAAKNGFMVRKKKESYALNQVDGEAHGHNGEWATQETVELTMRMVRGHEEKIVFDLVPIAEYQVILGATWLRKHNPQIDWLRETIVFDQCDCRPKPVMPRLKREDAALDQQDSGREH
jgi:hypothetical protein